MASSPPLVDDAAASTLWPAALVGESSAAIALGCLCFVNGFLAAYMRSPSAAAKRDVKRVSFKASTLSSPPTQAATPPSSATTSSEELAPTAAEWARFLAARRGDVASASAMWAAHARWRQATLPLLADAPAIGTGQRLPDYFAFLSERCRLGGRVLVCHAAMSDPSLASDAEYTRAIAAYLDAALPRDSAEQITIVVDCRGGAHWPNPPPSLARSLDVARVLRAHFPERMRRLVVFPVPWLLSAVWLGACRALGSRAAAKARLLTGPAHRSAPLPDGLAEHLGPAARAECEQVRALKLREAAERASEAAASSRR